MPILIDQIIANCVAESLGAAVTAKAGRVLFRQNGGERGLQLTGQNRPSSGHISRQNSASLKVALGNERDQHRQFRSGQTQALSVRSASWIVLGIYVPATG